MQNRLRSKHSDESRRDCNTRYYETELRKQNSESETESGVNSSPSFGSLEHPCPLNSAPSEFSPPASSGRQHPPGLPIFRTIDLLKQKDQRERSASSFAHTHQTHPNNAAPRNKNIPKVNIATGDAGLAGESQKEFSPAATKSGFCPN
jgi:hypothetical protein